MSDLQRLMRVFALAYRYRYRSCNVNTDRLGNYVLLNSLFSSTFPKRRSHGVRDASGGDNSCYLLQLITRKPQTRWRTWSDSNARRVNTVKSSPAKQRGPRYETVHASSIKELDEGKQAKALMVIEIGFLRGCQLAHQDVRQHQAPGVKRGPPLQSVWLETVSLKHGGTALARRGIRDLRGQDLDLRRVLVLLRCTSAFRSRTAGGRFEMPWKPFPQLSVYCEKCSSLVVVSKEWKFDFTLADCVRHKPTAKKFGEAPFCGCAPKIWNRGNLWRQLQNSAFLAFFI